MISKVALIGLLAVAGESAPLSDVANYILHSNVNAYTGFGATNIDTGSTSPVELTAAQCQQRCTDDPECDCVTYAPKGFGGSKWGRCWKRKKCMPSKFLRNQKHFDVYMKISYTFYEGKNSYNGYGGIDIDTDRTAPSELTVEQCQQRCTDDPNCDCVTYAADGYYSKWGRCWKRKQCVPSKFRSRNPVFDVYMKNSYNRYANSNSFSGRGGIDIDTDKDSPVGLTVAQCQNRCTADPECDCVTYAPDGYLSGPGRCWKHKQCLPGKFKTGEGIFDVYMKIDTSTPPTPPRRWVTVMGCDGPSVGDRILVDDVAALARNAYGLRVCTTGTEECVTATAKNEGLAQLAKGSKSFMPPGIGWCQEKCVNERWTGSEKLKFHMRWQCGPNRGHMFYHACGNTKGLHLDSRSGKQCTWDWGNKDAISVQLLVGVPPTQAPTHLPTPEPTPAPTPKPTTLVPTSNPTPAPSAEAEREFDPTGKVLIKENVCFGARSNEFGTVEIPKDMSVSGIYLVHRSGGVHNHRNKRECDNQYFESDGSMTSNFGGECDRRISMFFTDCSDNVIAPVSGTAGFKPYRNSWYYLDGFNSHSKYLGFEQDAKLKKGSYRIWYGEDKADFTEHDNKGTSCVDVYVAEKPMNLPMVGDGWAKIGNNVCIGTRDSTFGRFNIPFGEFTASQVKIVHKSGYVNCRRSFKACPKNDKTNGQSNFGCECNDNMSILVTGSDNKLVLPANVASIGWYTLPGYHSHSDEIVFDTPRTFSTGEYRVWYGEDLKGHTEWGNHGRACYDVLAKIDQEASLF